MRLARPGGLAARIGPLSASGSVPGRSRSYRRGGRIGLALELTLDAGARDIEVVELKVRTTSSLNVTVHGRNSRLAPNATVTIPLTVSSESAAVHRVLGVEATLRDAFGLCRSTVFVPASYEVATLPLWIPLRLRRQPETRHLPPRESLGRRADIAPGTGTELRELREHVPGDPFKHIAWKASARAGKLMTRVFERDRGRALYAIVDVGPTMRLGPEGRTPLDQALDAAYSLAHLASRRREPFGLALVDGEVLAHMPVCEGGIALRESVRVLVEARRVVVESHTTALEPDLVNWVGSYLEAVHRVRLPPEPHDPSADVFAMAARRTAVVRAAARRIPMSAVASYRGPDPSPDPDSAALRRFCHAMHIELPYRRHISREAHAAGIAAGLELAARERGGPFACLVLSDFRDLAGLESEPWNTLRAVRRAGHRALLLSLAEETDAVALSPQEWDAEALDIAAGLMRAQDTARTNVARWLRDEAARCGAIFAPNVTLSTLSRSLEAALWQLSVRG